MKASESPLISFLQGPKQYVIPIYQRTYSWTEKQCEQLWEDILTAAKNDKIPGHFLGSIVYIQKGVYQASAVNPLLVIDGQQRLTTLTLLFSALSKELDEQGDGKEITRKQIRNYYLFNNDEEGDKRYKLVLTQSDRETLLSILEERPLPTNSSKNIVDNYNYFVEQIKKSKIDLDSLYRGICKLIIVDISLDSNYDNPQLIFESLNSTGLELSQADLIRNFVLMRLDIKTQNEIYSNYWYPMERDFGHSEGLQYFDRFMRDYLTIKQNDIPKENEVYLKFKEFFTTEQKPTAEIVADIYYYSKFFIQLAFAKSEDEEINQHIQDINSLSVEVAYPFLIEVLVDCDKQIISKTELLEILEIIESYVFRRQICEIPTNSLNKTFATLYNLKEKENYLESLKAALILKDSYRRFPNDIEFHEQFMVKNVYNFRTRTYLFRKLENFGRKETVNVEEYTIEHIMPQNEKLPQVWQEELGNNWAEIHDKYLHRIGNLTLTGYNPELSDSSFKEKRDMIGGFKDSPIHLSSGIGNLEHWNEKEIEKRSRELADKAMLIWKFPAVPEQALKKYIEIEEEDEEEDEEEKKKHGMILEDLPLHK